MFYKYSQLKKFPYSTFFISFVGISCSRCAIYPVASGEGGLWDCVPPTIFTEKTFSRHSVHFGWSSWRRRPFFLFFVLIIQFKTYTQIHTYIEILFFRPSRVQTHWLYLVEKSEYICEKWKKSFIQIEIN